MDDDRREAVGRREDGVGHLRDDWEGHRRGDPSCRRGDFGCRRRRAWVKKVLMPSNKIVL